MSERVELEQVLRGALASEQSASLLYEALAEHAPGERARELFRTLADEERVHAVAIEALGDRFVGQVTPGASLADFHAAEEPGWLDEPELTLGRSLDLALAAEANAAEVYSNLSRAFEGKVAELFAGLVRSEQSHARQLLDLQEACDQATLERVLPIEPAGLRGSTGGTPAAEATWESGEDLITHATMMTHVWSETVVEATPANVGSSVLRRVLAGHDDGIRQMAFSPEGRYLVTVDEASEVFVWNVADGRLLTPLDAPTDGVAALEFSPDGFTIAIGSPSGAVTLWDLRTLPEDER